MSIITSEAVIEKISHLSFSDGTKLLDVISSIVIKETNIGFSIDISDKNIHEAKKLKQVATEKIKEIAYIDKVTIIFTGSANLDKKSLADKPKYLIDNIKKLILVASGKGGVGKSTVTAIIADELTSGGHKVGIVDADIYGPSIPQIFGLRDKPKIVNNKMIPLISRGIQIISIGFLAPIESAIVWRGPMASKTVYQLLSLTYWDNLDYLIIDMPPGTGDIHLSILENYSVDGAIIVTTPQRIAKIDVVRSIDLYKKFNLPILGIIENMSYQPEVKYNLFTGNSGEEMAKENLIPLISKIPVDSRLSYNCDHGISLNNIVNLKIKKYI